MKSYFELTRILCHLGFNIKVGGLYHHYKDRNQLYKVLNLGFFEENEKPCVVYQNQKSGMVWVRSCDSWLQKVDLPSNQTSDRFVKVD